MYTYISIHTHTHQTHTYIRTTVTGSKLHHILERAAGVSGELAPSTQVPVGKRNLAVRSPHARTSRRRKRHRVSKFLSLARTGGFTTVFFKFALQLLH